MDIEKLKYPVGPFERPDSISREMVAKWIDEIAALPAALRSAVEPLSEEQLELPYRPGGWCSRQVVHHIADSHLNSIMRFKLALTEERPTIRTYHEERWAELSDYVALPVESSLHFIEILHERWVLLLRGLGPEQLAREFVHPDMGTLTVDANIALYAWHGRHHLAHIQVLTEREGWVV